LELIPFLIITLLKAYDGWTNPSPKIEIENKYVRETRVLVYSLVFSAYVYTYVALHIRRCLKCRTCVEPWETLQKLAKIVLRTYFRICVSLCFRVASARKNIEMACSVGKWCRVLIHIMLL
jgi:hypothetical protein